MIGERTRDKIWGEGARLTWWSSTRPSWSSAPVDCVTNIQCQYQNDILEQEMHMTAATCWWLGARSVVMTLTHRYWWYAFCSHHRQARNGKLGWLLAWCFGRPGHKIRHLCGYRHTIAFVILNIGMSTSSLLTCLWPEREQAIRTIHLAFLVDQSRLGRSRTVRWIGVVGVANFWSKE